MVTINGIKYNTYEVKTKFCNFRIAEYKNGVIEKTIIGEAPYITFNMPNDAAICIETIYSKELLEFEEFNIAKDITEYISDILYNDWFRKLQF